MNQIDIHYYQSPFGELLLGAFNDKLCLCDWRYRKKRRAIDHRLSENLGAVFKESHNDVLQETIDQLEHYFSLKRTDFDLPLLLVGTAFQKKAWYELTKIPYGQTVSYLELAEKMGNRNSVRAVAAANGANAISIIIPCHRVIGSNGRLVGYAGGLSAKKRLLTLEHNLFNL